jgi:hypothetical protein
MLAFTPEETNGRIDLVVLTAAGYFFTPSITALRTILT